MAVCILLFGVLVGCGGSGPEEGTRWTVEEGGLTLERTLLAGDDEELFFGSIKDVSVRSDGRMYVVDGEATQIKVLTPDGTLRASIGSKGAGPGEFRHPSKVFIVRGDSLYVTHGGLATRLSAFGPNHEFAYEISFSSSVGPAQSTPDEAIPVPGDSGFFVVANPFPWPSKDPSELVGTVKRMSRDGTTSDTLFTFTGVDKISKKKNDGGFRFYKTPWTQGSYIAQGPEGNLHLVRNDSLTVRTYDVEGTLRGVVEIPFGRVPITESDRERVFSSRNYGDEAEAYVRKHMPSTKPVFQYFLVDNEGRYWFGRPTPDPDSIAWWVATPEERRVVTDTLSSDVELLTVRDGQAYGRATTEAGAPALVRYQFDLEPGTSE
jgi:hypothetical protein